MKRFGNWRTQKKNDDGDQSLTTSSCRWKGPSSIASASSSFFTWKKKKKHQKTGCWFYSLVRSAYRLKMLNEISPAHSTYKLLSTKSSDLFTWTTLRVSSFIGAGVLCIQIGRRLRSLAFEFSRPFPNCSNLQLFTREWKLDAPKVSEGSQ